MSPRHRSGHWLVELHREASLVAGGARATEYVASRRMANRGARVSLIVAVLRSVRINLSPFTKGCRECDTSMCLHQFL